MTHQDCLWPQTQHARCEACLHFLKNFIKSYSEPLSCSVRGKVNHFHYGVICIPYRWWINADGVGRASILTVDCEVSWVTPECSLQSFSRYSSPWPLFCALLGTWGSWPKMLVPGFQPPRAAQESVSFAGLLPSLSTTRKCTAVPSYLFNLWTMTCPLFCCHQKLT